MNNINKEEQYYNNYIIYTRNMVIIATIKKVYILIIIYKVLYSHLYH